MEILELALAGTELIAYGAAFWMFLLSPAFRRRQVGEYREASFGGRCVILIEGAVASACGLFPMLVGHWLLMA
jgi:hypothetical protein